MGKGFLLRTEHERVGEAVAHRCEDYHGRRDDIFLSPAKKSKFVVEFKVRG